MRAHPEMLLTKKEREPLAALLAVNKAIAETHLLLDALCAEHERGGADYLPVDNGTGALHALVEDALASLRTSLMLAWSTLDAIARDLFADDVVAATTTRPLPFPLVRDAKLVVDEIERLLSRVCHGVPEVPGFCRAERIGLLLDVLQAQARIISSDLHKRILSTNMLPTSFGPSVFAFESLRADRRCCSAGAACLVRTRPSC